MLPREVTLRDMAAVRTKKYSGIRSGAMASGEVKVCEGKGGKDRIVFLGPTGLQALQRYLRTRPNTRSDALFISREGGRITYEGVRQLIERKCAKAGPTRRYAAHDFRRAFTLNVHRAGVDISAIARLMGHSDIAVLKRYLALNSQDMEAAHRKGSPVENYRWT